MTIRKKNFVLITLFITIALILCEILIQDVKTNEIAEYELQLQRNNIQIDSLEAQANDCQAKKRAENIKTTKNNELNSEQNTTKFVGRFKVYAYCPCKKCCGKATGITATGTVATEGRTVAVDPSVIPLGSIIIIDGQEYIAEDVGAGIKGLSIDMFFYSHQKALEWGIRYKDIYTKGDFI